MALRSSTTKKGTGSTPSATVPTGVATDDIIILTVTQDDLAASFSGKFPSGFTMFDQQSITADGEKVAIGWKRATGADTGTYSFSATGSTNAWVSQCLAYSGRDTTNPPVNSTANVVNTGAASAVTVNANGVTAVAGDDLVWVSLPDISIGTATSPATNAPTGYTTQQNDMQGFAWAGVATKDNSGAGATGTVSGTISWSGGGTAGYCAYLIRIPASGGGGGAAAEELRLVTIGAGT